MENKHTELPWSFKRGYDNLMNADFEKEGIAGTIRSDDGWNVARIWKSCERFPHNAEFIVRACNSHYELLEACKYVFATLSGFQDNCKEFPQTRVSGKQVSRGLDSSVKAIKQAIAKATE